MRKWLALGGTILSVLVLVLLLSRIDLRGCWQNMRGLGWGNWLVAAGIYVTAFLPRGWRWKLMLPESERLPWAWVTKAVVIGYAANNLLPFRLGEVVRSYIVGERFKLSKLTCLATIAAEKILDGCCLLALLTACLPFVRIESGSAAAFHRAFMAASALFGTAIIACFILAFWNRPVLSLAGRVLPPGLMHVADAGLRAFAIFRRGKTVVATALLTLLTWLVEGACFVFVCWRVGVPDPWPRGMFCLVIVNLSILIPSAPGYVGVFQAGSVAAFVGMGLSASLGLAVGAAVHAAQFVPTTVAGLVLASAMGLKWRRIYQLRNE